MIFCNVSGFMQRYARYVINCNIFVFQIFLPELAWWTPPPPQAGHSRYLGQTRPGPPSQTRPTSWTAASPEIALIHRDTHRRQISFNSTLALSCDDWRGWGPNLSNICRPWEQSSKTDLGILTYKTPDPVLGSTWFTYCHCGQWTPNSLLFSHQQRTCWQSVILLIIALIISDQRLQSLIS